MRNDRRDGKMKGAGKECDGKKKKREGDEGKKGAEGRNKREA